MIRQGRPDQPTHRSQAPGPTGRQRVIHPLQTSVVNPLIRLAFRIGIPDPGDALLETTGRRTGKPRLTPVCDGLEGNTFWLLSQRGRDAAWVRDIEADPRVRVKLRSRRPTAWRSGTARILDDDDPHERQRLLSQRKPWRRLCLSTSGSLATDLLTVRIDLDPAVSPRYVSRPTANGIVFDLADAQDRSDIEGPRLDPEVFKPESVPAATLAVTERLRRKGATAPALRTAGIEELRSSPPVAAGVLAAEPQSDLAVERSIDGPAAPLRMRVLRSGKVRACYLHVHGGGWALGGPDRQDQTLLRFARVARVAVVAVDYRLTPEHPHNASPGASRSPRRSR
jgi:deazaflavin-dependent oxidoreductase (nitroreductase family)